MPEEVMTAPVETGVAPASEVTTSTPAVTETQVETTPQEFTAPSRESGEDDGAYARRFAEARTAYDSKTVKTEPTKEPAKEPVKEEAKEPEKVEQKTDEPVEDDPEVGDPLEDVAPLTPKEITEMLKADPELDAKLTASGKKAQFYENSRLASKALKFQEVFHDPDEARFAKGAAENFGTIDNFMTEIPTKGPQGVDALMTHMWNLDVVTDADGNPVLDDKGNTIPQGNVDAFVRNFSDMVWQQRFPAHLANLEAQAKAAVEANPDDEDANNILAAVEVLKSAKTGSVPQELPAHLKAEAERIKSESDKLAQTQEENRKAESQQWENGVLLQQEQAVHKEIDSLLGRTALPKEQFGLIRNEIYDAIVAQLEQDKMFLQKRDWIMKAKPSDAVAKARVAHGTSSMTNLLYGVRGNGVARQVLDKYGVQLLAKQGARKTTIDAQIKASQSEPKGKSSVAAPVGEKTPAEKRAIAVENLKKKGIQDGDSDFMRALMQEMMAL